MAKKKKKRTMLTTIYLFFNLTNDYNFALDSLMNF